MTTVLHLYSRPGCGLCEEFEAALLASYGHCVELIWCDVDRDPSHQQQFGERIPVLTDREDRVICESQLDFAALREFLGPPV